MTTTFKYYIDIFCCHYMQWMYIYFTPKHIFNCGVLSRFLIYCWPFGSAINNCLILWANQRTFVAGRKPKSAATCIHKSWVFPAWCGAMAAVKRHISGNHYNRLTASTFRGQQTFARPLGQHQYLAGPMGQPQILCGRRPLIICCGLRPQLSELLYFKKELLLHATVNLISQLT